METTPEKSVEETATEVWALIYSGLVKDGVKFPDNFDGIGAAYGGYTRLTEVLIAERQKRDEVVEYLSHFSYEDWDIGDDDKLCVGDYINLNHQRGHDGYEQNLEGKIVLHHVNKLPVLLYNIEPKTKDEIESGDYGDLQSFFMDDWTFSRIKELTQPNNPK